MVEVKPLGHLVRLEDLDDLAWGILHQGLDYVSRIIGNRVRKLRRGLYAISHRLRCDITPSIVYLAYAHCPVRAYYILTTESDYVTTDGLAAIIRGQLAHILYARRFRKLNKNCKVVPEVYVEGYIAGLEVHGRIDLLTLDEEDILVLELKTCARASKAAKIQAWCYKKLLDLDCVSAVVVAREEVDVVNGSYMDEFRQVAKTLLDSSEPPYFLIEQLGIEPKCNFCGFRIFCEYYHSHVRSRQQV